MPIAALCQDCQLLTLASLRWITATAARIRSRSTRADSSALSAPLSRIRSYAHTIGISQPASSSVCAVTRPPLVAFAVLTFGWRTAALLSGIGVFLLLPLAFLVRRSPESMGLLPDGETHGAKGRDARVPAAAWQDAPEYSAREALRTPTFWLLAAFHGLRNIPYSAVTVHLVPLLVWKGLDQPMAAFFVGLTAFCTVIVRPLTGWLGDRQSKQKIGTMGVLMGALGLAVLTYSDGAVWALVAFAILFAFGDGINSVTWALVGDCFGRSSFATIRGWIGMLQSVFSMPAAVFTGWVYDQTQEKIKDLLPEGILSSDTRMVLVNAIYFKADWLSQFDAADTFDAPFHLLDGTEVTVKTMHQGTFVPYFRGDGFQAVELPYAGDTAAMDILLPDEGNFEAFESSLNLDLFNETINSMQAASVMLSMPKFTFESQFKLSDTLKSMGMLQAFDPNGADFSGMEFSNSYAIAPRGASTTKTAYYTLATFFHEDGSVLEGAGSQKGRSVIARADCSMLSRVSWTIDRTTARPRPAPPSLRARPSSRRVNRSKTRSRSASGTPRPSSSTRSTAWPASSHRPTAT